MAGLILKVTPEEVKEKAHQIKGQKSQMEREMKNMMSKISRLHDRSDKEYQPKFQNVTREINDSLNALRKHANNLTKAAHEYSHSERSNAAKVRSFSAENIF